MFFKQFKNTEKFYNLFFQMLNKGLAFKIQIVSFRYVKSIQGYIFRSINNQTSGIALNGVPKTKNIMLNIVLFP